METKEDELWREWDVLTDVLGDDVLRFEKLIDTEDCAAWRRNYCRALFALIEASAEWMKRYTIHCYYPGMLDESEKKVLQSRNGALLGFFAALDLFADTSGADTPLKKGSKEWVTLQNAIKIRNRITHPKSPKDIEISDADLAHLQLTKEMYISLVSCCFIESGRALRRQGKKLLRQASIKKKKLIKRDQ